MRSPVSLAGTFSEQGQLYAEGLSGAELAVIHSSDIRHTPYRSGALRRFVGDDVYFYARLIDRRWRINQRARRSGTAAAEACAATTPATTAPACARSLEILARHYRPLRELRGVPQNSGAGAQD